MIQVHNKNLTNLCILLQDIMQTFALVLKTKKERNNYEKT